jgi:hypothetical protein
MRTGNSPELRDLVPSPYIKHRPTGMSLLYTYLRQPSKTELQTAMKLYRAETGGLPGEMTQDDLNQYVDILRSRG